MGAYAIKELEELTGIKAHTIRIWEKRYHLVRPGRTRNNVRCYSDFDLKRIINVATLVNHGYRISAIAGMTDDALVREVIALSESHGKERIYIDQFVTTMLDLDEQKFEDTFKMLERKFGFEETVSDVIYPFLEKIGILWQTGNITPAHEHFISNLIRQRLIVAIASLPVVTRSTMRVLLFLPEHELHEIALLFYHYIARKAGLKTFYLGQSVPHDDLRAVYEIHKPHLLITSLTSQPPVTQLNGYLNRLSEDFRSSLILASGVLLRKASFTFPGNLRYFETTDSLKALLRFR